MFACFVTANCLHTSHKLSFSKLVIHMLVASNVSTCCNKFADTSYNKPDFKLLQLDEIDRFVSSC